MLSPQCTVAQNGSDLSKLLASLVWHRGYLIQTLPPTSPVFQTALFAMPRFFPQLKSIVQCGLQSPVMTGTGIPPHVLILQRFSTMIERFDALEETVRNDLPKRILNGVDELMEQKGTHFVISSMDF